MLLVTFHMGRWIAFPLLGRLSINSCTPLSLIITLVKSELKSKMKVEVMIMVEMTMGMEMIMVEIIGI